MFSKITLWLALCLSVMTPALALAQGQDQAAAATTGKIHGHVQDPTGIPLANAIIQVSTNGTDVKYTFNTNQDGDYTGSGVAPGTYVLTLFQVAGKAIDRFQNVKVTAGQDTLQDFDLSRADYVKALPPEQQKAIEEAKAKNAQVMKDNQSIKHLNEMLVQARADDKEKKFDDAANLMQQAVALKPDVAILWLELGNAQLGQKKYDDAANSYNKSLQLDAAEKKPDPVIQAAAEGSLGEALADSNKLPEAAAAYEAAVKLQPAMAATYYTNEAIVLSRTTQTDATVAAADKAIAADPNKAIAYYLKGQALVSKATVDPQTHKIVAPPGTAEAYEKYLDLDPMGPFASAAQAVLMEIGEKINSKYSAKKK